MRVKRSNRTRSTVCRHHVLVGHSERRGLCLDCRAVVPTPFTLGGSQLIGIDEWRFPPPAPGLAA